MGIELWRLKYGGKCTGAGRHVVLTLRRYDDLMEEERDAVQIALKRLSPKESYDRIFRIRRATQCSYQHKLLPKSEWTKAEDVRPSLHRDTIVKPGRADSAATGHPIPAPPHRAGRGRDGREGRPRLHGGYQQALGCEAGSGLRWIERAVYQGGMIATRRTEARLCTLCIDRLGLIHALLVC